MFREFQNMFQKNLQKRNFHGKPSLQYSRVKKIINHPDFNRDFLSNDINLLLLEKAFEITNYVRPAFLPQLSEYRPENGATCVSSGFGEDVPCDVFDGFHPTNLKNVDLEIVDNEICAQKNGIDIENSQLCAAVLQDGSETCQGDSGGPLVCDVDGRWTLTGVVSLGLEFGHPDFPDVFTRVAYYLKWIWNNNDLEPQLLPEFVTPSKLENSGQVFDQKKHFGKIMGGKNDDLDQGVKPSKLLIGTDTAQICVPIHGTAEIKDILFFFFIERGSSRLNMNFEKNISNLIYITQIFKF